MNNVLKSKKIIYIFYFLIAILALNTFFVFTQFTTTKKVIQKNSFDSNIAQVAAITSNISDKIKNDCTKNSLVKTLKQNDTLRIHLQKELELFRTNYYRYIYVVYRDGDKFKFLLDGAKNDKADFLDTFQPANIEKWNRVYTTKKALYFTHKDTSSLWLTYLNPIIIDGKVEGILAIDFSIKEQNTIKDSVEILSKVFKIFILLLLFILIVLSLFLLFERKRVELIQKQSNEIQAFNETLNKRIDEEVKKNRQKDKQMQEQARLAQMGEMIGMIAHQWRQPLSAISSANIVISMKAQLGELDTQTALELTQKIAEFTEHLSHTIDDFRDFFKDTKEKKDITYNQLIESTLKIVEGSFKNHNIELIQELQSDTLFHTYTTELKQVLLNLIKNAEDVLLEKEIEHPYIKISTNNNILQVSDNGGGIPDDIIDKIFDPYFSTKSLNGTGLGLYMSKTIIQEHCQGNLSVKNDENGAVFTVEL